MAEIFRSSVMHALFAVIIQSIVALATGGDIAAGAIAGAAYFLGREVAQRQYHLAGWVQGRKGVSIKSLKPWAGFDIIRWNVDELLDIALPVIAVALVYLLSRLFA